MNNHLSRAVRPIALAAVLLAGASTPALAVAPAAQLAAYTVQAGTPPLPARGQQLFTTKHGKDWSWRQPSTPSASPIQPKLKNGFAAIATM